MSWLNRLKKEKTASERSAEILKELRKHPEVLDIGLVTQGKNEDDDHSLSSKEVLYIGAGIAIIMGTAIVITNLKKEPLNGVDWMDEEAWKLIYQFIHRRRRTIPGYVD